MEEQNTKQRQKYTAPKIPHIRYDPHKRPDVLPLRENYDLLWDMGIINQLDIYYLNEMKYQIATDFTLLEHIKPHRTDWANAQHGASSTQMAYRLDISYQLLRYHMNKLCKAGLVIKTKAFHPSIGVRYFPMGCAQEILDDFYENKDFFTAKTRNKLRPKHATTRNEEHKNEPLQPVKSFKLEEISLKSLPTLLDIQRNVPRFIHTINPKQSKQPK